jgi:hypothetical protein
MIYFVYYSIVRKKKIIMEMENEKDKMCDICGAHKDGRYRWVRLLLAVLLGVFIFLAGIQIGEMRGEVYGYRGHTMRWDMRGNDMMWNDQGGSTSMIVVPTDTQTTPTTPSSAMPVKGAPVPTTNGTTPNNK